MKSHFDCIITPVARHFYMEEWGFDQSVTALSTMIRKNMISREEAISRLNVDSSVDAELMDFFLKRLEIKSEEIKKCNHI
jgi:hypothetical protein